MKVPFADIIYIAFCYVLCYNELSIKSRHLVFPKKLFFKQKRRIKP